MAHWIDAGEQAPYSGMLLNTYTYENLKYIADHCIRINAGEGVPNGKQ